MMMGEDESVVEDERKKERKEVIGKERRPEDQL